jgi:hypothetical protein
MINDDNQSLDWVAWRAILKKTHTQAEFTEVVHALPILRKPLEPIASINDYIVISDHYRPLGDIQFNSLCQDHVKLFEKAIGLPLQDFLCNPDRQALQA